MASKFDSSLELSPFDQAILRIVWRNEKGHIGNTWHHVFFFYQKRHGAAPFYFSLDKTPRYWHFHKWHMDKIRGQRHRATLQDYKATWTLLLAIDKAKSTFTRRLLRPNCLPICLVDYFIVLVHWNNSPHIAMSTQLDTFSWFRANQSLLFLLNAVCLAKK